MAALCPGVQYGLSSQENFGENKDLIFVKLTDSALRAIEEYLKNKHKFSYKENPSIKFLGNEGHLAFPSIHNGGTTSFKFSVSSTSDMEGPGGSFECIQQTGPSRNKLEALGSIPFKMRIHANDDVYAATKQRMTVAEENHKNKCTREIKPNQTDIGRKVKLKQNIRQSLIPARSRDPPPTNYTNSNNDGPIKNSYLSSNSVSSKTLVSNSSSSNHSNGYTNGYSSSNNYNNGNSFRPHQNKPSVPDIARRPLKERLIHLLALRPHNKMELHERLTKEGLREKSSMTSVLKQIANMKGNYFYLNRSMCNDVNEDWPFYTESEKQTLKRRKPQNLSPPDSSDSGSSGSGRSPTSTHPGSPPPITASAQKRPGYYDGADGLPTKRPRISHCKPSEQLPPAEHNTLRRPITDSRDASNMNPRSRESPVPPYGMMLNDNITNGPKRNGMNGNESEDFSFTNNTNGKINGKINGTRYSPVKPEPLMPRKDTMENRNGYSSNKRGYLDYDAPPDVIVREKISPDSQRRATPSPVEVASNTLPDYLTEYTTIKNGEQRRTYKADFNANYAEYKSLHGTVEKVSRRFAELEERLKQEDSSSPRYKDIKRQIVKEYQENKKNKIHQTSKQRFQYLHDKLSHIKRLVMEYDQAVMDSQD